MEDPEVSSIICLNLHSPKFCYYKVLWQLINQIHYKHINMRVELQRYIQFTYLCNIYVPENLTFYFSTEESCLELEFILIYLFRKKACFYMIFI